MKTRKILAILVLALGLMVCQAEVSEAGPMGTAFTYQGHLYDANHVADGLYDFQFKLYDANSGGSQIGSDVNKPDVDVIDALFTVELDFGDVYDGNERWLEIGVRPGDLNDPNVYTMLSPLQEVTPTPHALYAQTAGSDGDWAISDGNMYSIPSGNVGIGTTSPEFKLTLDNDGGIIAKGTYNSGSDLTVSGAGTRLIWYPKKAAFRAGEVTGGQWDDPNIGNYSVAMGKNNTAMGLATVGGGSNNTAGGICATVGGGNNNTASWHFATVGGGSNNSAGGFAFPGSGHATVGGGYNNTASGNYVTVGGGQENTASGDRATVGGGSNNTASVGGDTVGGGIVNTASGGEAVVGGGYVNTASGSWATVGGGGNNTASGSNATVPGGEYNTAGGSYSFAAGRRAKANHDGTFVWADGTDANFASTDTNQFLIRASGGVGIGVTDPCEALDVSGTARLRGISNGAGSPVVVDANGTLWKTVSSKRYKRNIEELEIDADAVLKLRPVSFQYKSSGQKDIGLIAEEVQEQLPNLVIYDKQGRPDAVKYEKVSLYLLAVVKQLKAENQSLRQRLEVLERTKQQEFGGVKEVQQ